MKLSVVTCTWNSAATLGDTITSVQSQRDADIEHIFVDGGSTDGTLDMIAQRCPHAVVLRDVTGGISRAMNEGAAVATGEVLAHLHSDDYYANDRVAATAAKAFEDHQGLQWLFGRIAVLREGVIEEPQHPMREFSYARFVRGGTTVPHPAVFVRTSVFRELGGFKTTRKYAMDIDLWMRLGRQYAPLQIDQVFTVFREHAGSLSTANVLAARAEECSVHLEWATRAPFDTLIYYLRYLRRVRRLKRQTAAAAG